MLTVVLWSGQDGKPLNLELYKLYSNVRTGQEKMKTNLIMHSKYMKHILSVRTKPNPDEYSLRKSSHSKYKETKLNSKDGCVSSVQQKVKRGSRHLCLVKWVTDYQSTRTPSSIQMAICSNGGSTTCSCMQHNTTFQVRIYHGMNPNTGDPVLRLEKQSIPTDCTLDCVTN